MTVYVDNYNTPFRGFIMCHMISDNLEELHTMAKKIGLKFAWFQNKKGDIPHYDVSLSKKKEAIAAGAVELDLKKREDKMKLININKANIGQEPVSWKEPRRKP